MGAWSEETFGNDAACDWLADFLESPNIEMIEALIDEVLRNNGYIDSHQGSLCLASCEVIARVIGHGGNQDAYTEKLDEWIGNQTFLVPEELLTKCRVAAARILSENSELRGLWDEDEDWLSVVGGLIKRLADHRGSG